MSELKVIFQVFDELMILYQGLKREKRLPPACLKRDVITEAGVFNK